MKLSHFTRIGMVLLLLLLSFSFGSGQNEKAFAASDFTQINHIVVIYLENRSFDNIYGLFPGANGLNNAQNAAPQVDKDGKVYPKLPPILNTNKKPAEVDTRFPTDLPNQPFEIDKYLPNSEATGDLVHRYYQQQMQIDGGKMDKFAAISDAQGLTMGYYDGSKLPLWQYAKDYTLSDNFFHAAFGGSFLNHFWLVCACSPKWDNAPDSIKAQLDTDGNMVKDGQVTPDGYAINTSFTINQPHPATITNTALLVPQQSMPTIGDRLNDKNISWVWYSEGWNDALAGKADKLFQFHHQPFAFFQNYADGTQQKTLHLKDGVDFTNALKSGDLPAVSFYKPLGEVNEHPGYTDLLQGEQHTADLIKQLQQSSVWKDTAIIITYDENGGEWDHVGPPKVDKWGPGARVPTLIISSFAKKGMVDHTSYDTTSILKLIENRYGLQPLGSRDAGAGDLQNAFDFTQSSSTQSGGATPGLPNSGEGGAAGLQLNKEIVLLLVVSLAGVAGFAIYGLKRTRRKRNSR